MLLRPNVSSDWPGSGRNFMGQVIRMVTSTDVTISPIINFPSFTVYKASSEMTFYQKKHDVKLFRPLILPLTQVSKNSFFLILSYTSQINSSVSHALDPKKAGGGNSVFSNGVMKMSLLLKDPDTVYPV